LEFRAAENLPELPQKKLFFNKNAQFVKDRMRSLNKYIKSIILIYEAIENPILQRFLEIDTLFNPNYEYEPIDVDPDWRKKQRARMVQDDVNNDFIGDVSSLFLEGDKMAKTKRRWEDKKEGKIRKMDKQEEQEKYLLQ
jgi:hypothetical protein